MDSNLWRWPTLPKDVHPLFWPPGWMKARNLNPPAPSQGGKLIKGKVLCSSPWVKAKAGCGAARLAKDVCIIISCRYFELGTVGWKWNYFDLYWFILQHLFLF